PVLSLRMRRVDLEDSIRVRRAAPLRGEPPPLETCRATCRARPAPYESTTYATAERRGFSRATDVASHDNPQRAHPRPRAGSPNVLDQAHKRTYPPPPRRRRPVGCLR